MRNYIVTHRYHLHKAKRVRRSDTAWRNKWERRNERTLKRKRKIQRERERGKMIERTARSGGGRRGRITMRGYKRRRISVWSCRRTRSHTHVCMFLASQYGFAWMHQHIAPVKISLLSHLATQSWVLSIDSAQPGHSVALGCV